MRKDQDCIKRLKGDGLSVKMDSNYRVLEVTGDGCKITLAKNCGSVHVVGDGCRVRVTHNVGDIVYTGDGGQVLLGPKSSKEKVKYFGDGGKVSFDSEPKKRNSSPRKEETGGSPKLSTILKNYCGTDKDEKREECEQISPEVVDNQCNERKEKIDCKEDDKDTRNAKKTTVFVTTRVTTSNDPRDLYGVEKWFVAPSTVVRSFVNNVPTVTVGEQKSTTNPRN